MGIDVSNVSSGRAAARPPPTRPRPGALTGRVWEIADGITREAGRRAERREVIERYVAENGNPNTAATQYQHWKKHYEAVRKGSEPAPSGRPRTIGLQPLRIAPDGRVLIPLEMREAMALEDDDRVLARVEEGELRLVSPTVAVQRIQSRMRKYRKPGESVVDRFLADRRKMWGEE